MTTATEPVRLAKTQIREAGEVLARALYDDPLTVWVEPNSARRARVLPWSMAVYARYGHRYGEVYTTAEAVGGAAIWIPPGKFPISLVGLMLAGYVLRPLKGGLAGFVRAMSAMGYVEGLHKQHVPRPHWYLLFLGVDPPHQGQGVGGALVQPVLARADAEGLPCYLESTNARKLPFYKRHGFEVVVEDDLPRGGPRFWTMKREPVG